MPSFPGKGTLAVAGVAGLAVVAAVWLTADRAPTRAQAPAGGARPPVSVLMAKAERKTVPVEIDSIGTVSPIASVALKSRVDAMIEKVHFEDGARVTKDDVLFTLDARQIDAQIMQAEGTLAKDRAQLEGAQRDVQRYRELIGKGATTQVNLDNALTQVNILTGTVQADEAALSALKVQKSYMTIKAPISGRMSPANLKAGNFVKSGDANALATINQIAPIYVAFSVTQQALPQLREALAAATARVSVKVPGADVVETGKVAVIDNAVDTTTGMVTARAIMDNASETLWPGTLVNVRLVVREEAEALVVPTVAIQRSQDGDFVFVVENGQARTQPVKVARTQGTLSVIAEGLSGGETVVTDGQLSLTNGSRVVPRGGGRPPGAGPPAKTGS